MMREFNYYVKHTEFIPESVTVKGQTRSVYIDESVGCPQADYYQSYGDEGGYWSIYLRVYPPTGEFYITAKIDGEVIAEDNFYCENISVSEMIDRYVKVLEEHLK